jgi:hypothetical protein
MNIDILPTGRDHRKIGIHSLAQIIYLRRQAEHEQFKYWS